VCHDVELDSLRQRTALPDCHNIALLHAEARTAVCVNILVALLKAAVLLDVVKIVSPHDNGALHLGRDDESLQDLPTNGDISSEGALLINVGALDGSVGGFDAQANILHPAHWLHLLGINITLAGDEDGIL